MLLFMYQKFRLIRERKQLELEQMKDFSVANRIKKNEQNVQKRYASIFNQIDQQAKNYISMAQHTINANAGMGFGMSNPMDYSGMGNLFIRKFMIDTLAGGKLGKKDISLKGSGYTLEDMMNNPTFKDADGNPLYDEADIALFKELQNAGYMAQQQAQQNASWIIQQVTNNINNWANSTKQMYEEEQNAALDALAYEQTMYDLDKTAREQRLAEIDAEIKNCDSKLQEKAQDMPPKFGLA